MFRKSQQTLQNIYSRKDIASAVSFFRVDELTSGQVNELIAIGGNRDRVLEDKVTEERCLTFDIWLLIFDVWFLKYYYISPNKKARKRAKNEYSSIVVSSLLSNSWRSAFQKVLNKTSKGRKKEASPPTPSPTERGSAGNRLLRND